MSKKDAVRQEVRRTYGAIAASGDAGCGCAPSCCSPQPVSARESTATLGYSAEEVDAAPEGSNMGLGCGNPQAIAKLKRGETVLDLGAGGGFDCFLAALRVGEEGRVIGVDMTPEMIGKARENAVKGDHRNVEFRLGEIEHLPVEDNSVDVIISNCVINLSPDKPQLFREAYRVLRAGGRLAVSDIVAVKALPENLRSDIVKYTGCVAGAATTEELTAMLGKAGFAGVRVELREESRAFIKEWFPGTGIEEFVVSANIEATK